MAKKAAGLEGVVAPGTFQVNFIGILILNKEL
jgi:hypothetical protein